MNYILYANRKFIFNCILGLLTFSYIFTLSSITYIILGLSIIYAIYIFKNDKNTFKWLPCIWKYSRIFFLFIVMIGIIWVAGTIYSGGNIKLICQRMEWMIYPLFLGCFWGCLCFHAISLVKKVTAGSVLFIFCNISYQAMVLHISRPFEWLSNDYCNTIAGIIIFLLFSFVTIDWNKNKWYKIFTVILYISALWTLIVLQSRGALLGAMVAFGVMIVYGMICYIRQRAFFISKFIYVLLISSIVFGGGVIMQYHSLWDRSVNSLVAFQQIYIHNIKIDSHNVDIALKGGGDRIFLWQSAIKMIQDHPVVGIGTNRFNEVYNKSYILPQARERDIRSPHNIFLHILVENGFIGGIPYISLLGYVFVYLIKSIKYGNGQAIAVLLGVIAILMQGMVDWPFLQRELSQIVWFFIGLIISENIKMLYNKKK